MEDKMVEYLDKVKIEYVDELYFKDIDIKYSAWIQNVASEVDKKILNELLYNLRFFSKKEIKSLLREKITALKKVNDDFKTTAFVPITPEDGRYNGSNEMISLIKELDKEDQLNGTRLVPYRSSIINDIKYVNETDDTLIFIDDISGTGGTIKKFINKNHKNMKNRKVIFLLIAATKQAIDNFESLSEKYGDIDFELIYCIELKKISSINILSTEEYEKLHGIEEMLWGKENKNILGYKQSELLVLFSHNIPNNTVSSFWYYSEREPDKWKRLFTRITAPNRKKQNYHNKKRTKV